MLIITTYLTVKVVVSAQALFQLLGNIGERKWLVLICRLSPPPAPAGLLRSRAPLSLARHLPTLWGVILPEGAFKLKLIAKAATPQAASRPAPLEGEPGRPMTSIGPYSIGVEESRPRRGQYGRRPKSVKKIAALLQFLAFGAADHNFGVPRGE